jgi:hypothetical protein
MTIRISEEVILLIGMMVGISDLQRVQEGDTSCWDLQILKTMMN